MQVSVYNVEINDGPQDPEKVGHGLGLLAEENQHYSIEVSQQIMSSQIHVLHFYLLNRNKQVFPRLILSSLVLTQ